MLLKVKKIIKGYRFKRRKHTEGSICYYQCPNGKDGPIDCSIGYICDVIYKNNYYTVDKYCYVSEKKI